MQLFPKSPVATPIAIPVDSPDHIPANNPETGVPTAGKNAIAAPNLNTVNQILQGHYGDASSGKDWGVAIVDGAQVKLEDVLGEKSKFLYAYDFGDDWHNKAFRGCLQVGSSGISP